MHNKIVSKLNGHTVKEVSCNLCQGTDVTVLFQKNTFSYVQCNNCNLVYVREQLTPQEVQKIYERGYDSKRQSKADPRDFSSYKDLLQNLRPYRQNNRLLDVGCFMGKFLYGAQVDGWNVAGVEISEQAVTFCDDELGLRNVFCSTLEANTELQPGFDVITMIDLIEHLADPLVTVQRSYDLLREGGVLYVETPNFASIARLIYGQKWRVFFPWHFYYFTPKTLKRTLQRVGFKQIEINTTQLGPLSSFDPYKSLNSGGGISDAKSTMNKIKKQGFVQQNYQLVKKTFLSTRKLEKMTFRVTDAVGLKFGGRLIAYATK